jgi:hypothetical protein
MDLPPQPPPDAPAPPPGPEAMRSLQVMKWILRIGGISVAFTILYFLLPRIIYKKRSPHDLGEALSNSSQIGLSLFVFEEEYERFPDATTIPAVQAATGTKLALGDSSSNDLFRQLLATVGRSEKIFWAKTASTPKKPDDILGADALVPGECAFTYIAGLTSTSHPDAPILMTPVVPGTWKFDPKPFNGEAIILFLNSSGAGLPGNSATRLPIDKNGDVILNGMNLFDPRQPFWRGKAPDIKYPE